MTRLDSRGETQIITSTPLHKDDGTLNVVGYAFSLLPRYDRTRIPVSDFRLKEWDYYLVNDEEYALALTLSDLGYVGMISASLLDFTTSTYITTTELTVLPLGRFEMPSDSSLGISQFANKRVNIRFEATPKHRTLQCEFKKFRGNETLICEFELDEIPRDSMVIVTPFDGDDKAFYFNQKIDAMRASGFFVLGAEKTDGSGKLDTLSLFHEFSSRESFGLLDWGRGVWTYDNTWFWGFAQGWQNGKGQAGPDASNAHRFGMNIGYGFGNTTAASENMCFIDGKAIKLGRLDFGIPATSGHEKAKHVGDRYKIMEPWHIRDEEGRLDLVFTPEIDRFDLTDLALIVTDQHQVFGKFNGTLILDDGSTFEIADLRGAAEVVHNRY